MASAEFEKRWRVTRAILRRAQCALPRDHRSTYIYALAEAEFEECIAHKELDSALELLAEIGNSVPCRGGFWRDLERAATVMNLSARAEHFRTRFLSAKPNSDWNTIER